MNTQAGPADDELVLPLPIPALPPGEDSEEQGEPEALRFYAEWRKIYRVAHHLACEQQRQQVTRLALLQRIQTLETQLSAAKQQERRKEWEEGGQEEGKRVRERRRAEQIEKKFRCEVACCERSYGSEGSLQQHIKLKHPGEYYRLQREAERGC